MAGSRYSKGDYARAQVNMWKNQLGMSIERPGDMTGAGTYIRNSHIMEDNNVLFLKELEEDEAAFRKRTGR